MTRLFPKDSVKRIQKRLKKTRLKMEESFGDFETLYKMVSEAWVKKHDFEKHYKITSNSAREAIVFQSIIISLEQ